MHEYETTHLWASAFAPRTEPEAAARDRESLRHALSDMRANAALLAAEIHLSMPAMTVHDISHLDALWALASEVAGEAMTLTPTEGVVFGGAVLLHDLGMGVAAYPEGPAALQASDEWTDAVALAFRSEHGRYPTHSELDAAVSDHVDDALALLLRRRHAKQAERLGHASWRVSPAEESDEIFLVPSNRVRASYGEAMGVVAASHWWPIERVRMELDRVLNPDADALPAWCVDLLKLSALLRVADAIHLDARRAPPLLRAVRRPTGDSEQHWTFQSHLHRPTVVGDRVRFTSGKPFQLKERAAWWLGYDLVRLADRELRSVDDVLVDLGRERLLARGVLSVDTPAAFAQHVRPTGWEPIDAALRISDVAGLISRMGGAELYGDDPVVPLRELLQNATDAVRARRLAESRPSDWGSVTVAFRSSANASPAIEVTDTGVGMSMHTLTTTLLDFGKSTWRSAELVSEYPGLAGAGFEPTGRFGIGFFSTLMWGDEVTVRTRRPEDASSATRVLELLDGARSRPYVRPSDVAERLVDGGSAIRVTLERLGEVERADAKALRAPESAETLARLCAVTAPASTVTIYTDVKDEIVTAISADDWETLSPEELLDRCADTDRHGRAGRDEVRRLSDLREADTRLVGRAALSPYGRGVITVGGFRAAEADWFEGILIGDHPTLARNEATPVVSPAVLLDWFRDQADRIASQRPAAWHSRVASTLVAYGLQVPDLAVCSDEDGNPITMSQLETWAREQDEVILLDDGDFETWLSENGYHEDRRDDIEVLRPFIVPGSARLFDFSPYGLAPRQRGGVVKLICDAVTRAWACERPVARWSGSLTIGQFKPTGDDVDLYSDIVLHRSP